jgi:hypothetical protein
MQYRSTAANGTNAASGRAVRRDGVGLGHLPAVRERGESHREGEADVIGEHLLRGGFGGDLREVFLERERALDRRSDDVGGGDADGFAHVRDRRQEQEPLGVEGRDHLDQRAEVVDDARGEPEALHVGVERPPEVGRHGELPEPTEAVLQHPVHRRRRGKPTRRAEARPR